MAFQVSNCEMCSLKWLEKCTTADILLELNLYSSGKLNRWERVYRSNGHEKSEAGDSNIICFVFFLIICFGDGRNILRMNNNSKKQRRRKFFFCFVLWKIKWHKQTINVAFLAKYRIYDVRPRDITADDGTAKTQTANITMAIIATVIWRNEYRITSMQNGMSFSALVLNMPKMCYMCMTRRLQKIHFIHIK